MLSVSALIVSLSACGTGYGLNRTGSSDINFISCSTTDVWLGRSVNTSENSLNKHLSCSCLSGLKSGLILMSLIVSLASNLDNSIDRSVLPLK